MNVLNKPVRRGAIIAGLLILSGFAHAGGQSQTYQVTITNISKGQTFTPQLVATHDGKVELFTLGSPASGELEELAEGGDTQPLTNRLYAENFRVADVKTIDGLLGPGQSVSITVESTRRHKYLSLAAMLIPTNDTFVALNRVRLPDRSKFTYTALAYDAGTEFNDQNCANIPGPRCGGAGPSPGPNDDDEGFVYVSNGFHDLPASDATDILGPVEYDWRNPVAKITVERLH